MGTKKRTRLLEIEKKRVVGEWTEKKDIEEDKRQEEREKD
jgi:hypothetical protein